MQHLLAPFEDHCSPPSPTHLDCKLQKDRILPVLLFTEFPAPGIEAGI